MNRHLRTWLLLPVALLVVLWEDVIWAGARALLRALRRLPPVRWLDGWLRALPGWAALPLFLLLEVASHLGSLWSVVLLVQGHKVAAVVTYVLVRLLVTLVAVFVFHACETALKRYAWFSAVLAFVDRARGWALAMIAPWREWARRVIGRSRSRWTLRLVALRRVLAVRRFGTTPER